VPLPNHDQCRTCGNTRTYDELINGGGTCRECRTPSETRTWDPNETIEAIKALVNRQIDRALARPPVRVLLGPQRPNPFLQH